MGSDSNRTYNCPTTLFAYTVFKWPRLVLFLYYFECSLVVHCALCKMTVHLVILNINAAVFIMILKYTCILTEVLYDQYNYWKQKHITFSFIVFRS